LAHSAYSHYPLGQGWGFISEHSGVGVGYVPPFEKKNRANRAAGAVVISHLSVVTGGRRLNRLLKRSQISYQGGTAVWGVTGQRDFKNEKWVGGWADKKQSR